MPHIIYHPDKPVGAFNVEEYCPFCDTDIPILFDLDDADNIKTQCPKCGRTLMICTMCPHRSHCNWSREHGCYINPHAYIPEQTMTEIRALMDDHVSALVYAQLAPCTNEEFILRYLSYDPNFTTVLQNLFGLNLLSNSSD